MENKRPIDRKRESGGHIDVGSEDDGAILECVNIKGKLIIIKEKAVYRISTADEIDSGRTNINLPNLIPQVIVKKGIDDEVVAKIFLLAKTLFKSSYFDSAIDSESAILLSIDLLQEVTTLLNEINAYLLEERSAIHEYENQKGQNYFAVPVVDNVETRCKTIFQKTDHVEQILIDIVKVFFAGSRLNNQSRFIDFYKFLVDEYGETDFFSVFVKAVLPFMEMIRALRNCLDHRLTFIKVKNFDLQPDSTIISPTIELAPYRGSCLERISLSSFFSIVNENIMKVVEDTFAFLAQKKVKSGWPYQVLEVPENKRRYKFVKYSFWSPMGEGGFFHQ